MVFGEFKAAAHSLGWCLDQLNIYHVYLYIRAAEVIFKMTFHLFCSTETIQS